MTTPAGAPEPQLSSNSTAAGGNATQPWFDSSTVALCSTLAVPWLFAWALGLYIIHGRREYLIDRTNCCMRHIDRCGSVVLERGEMERLFWTKSTRLAEKYGLLLLFLLDGMQTMSCAVRPTVTWGYDGLALDPDEISRWSRALTLDLGGWLTQSEGRSAIISIASIAIIFCAVQLVYCIVVFTIGLRNQSDVVTPSILGQENAREPPDPHRWRRVYSDFCFGTLAFTVYCIFARLCVCDYAGNLVAAPAIRCWGQQHRAILVPAVIALIVYHLFAVIMVLSYRCAELRAGDVRLDGRFALMELQGKFALALLTALFGADISVDTAVPPSSNTTTMGTPLTTTPPSSSMLVAANTKNLTLSPKIVYVPHPGNPLDFGERGWVLAVGLLTLSILLLSAGLVLKPYNTTVISVIRLSWGLAFVLFAFGSCFAMLDGRRTNRAAVLLITVLSVLALWTNMLVFKIYLNSEFLSPRDWARRFSSRLSGRLSSFRLSARRSVTRLRNSAVQLKRASSIRLRRMTALRRGQATPFPSPALSPAEIGALRAMSTADTGARGVSPLRGARLTLANGATVDLDGLNVPALLDSLQEPDTQSEGNHNSGQASSRRQRHSKRASTIAEGSEDEETDTDSSYDTDAESGTDAADSQSSSNSDNEPGGNEIRGAEKAVSDADASPRRVRFAEDNERSRESFTARTTDSPAKGGRLGGMRRKAPVTPPRRQRKATGFRFSLFGQSKSKAAKAAVKAKIAEANAKSAFAKVSQRRPTAAVGFRRVPAEDEDEETAQAHSAEGHEGQNHADLTTKEQTESAGRSKSGKDKKEDRGDVELTIASEFEVDSEAALAAQRDRLSTDTERGDHSEDESEIHSEDEDEDHSEDEDGDHSEDDDGDGETDEDEIESESSTEDGNDTVDESNDHETHGNEDETKAAADEEGKAEQPEFEFSLVGAVVHHGTPRGKSVVIRRSPT